MASLAEAREAGRRRINDLAALRRTPVSPHDRGVITLNARGMTLFWRQQGDYASAALARLIRVTVDAGGLPPFDTFGDGPVAARGGGRQVEQDVACGRYERPAQAVRPTAP